MRRRRRRSGERCTGAVRKSNLHSHKEENYRLVDQSFYFSESNIGFVWGFFRLDLKASKWTRLWTFEMSTHGLNENPRSKEGNKMKYETKNEGKKQTNWETQSHRYLEN